MPETKLPVHCPYCTGLLLNEEGKTYCMNCLIELYITVLGKIKRRPLPTWLLNQKADSGLK